MSLWQACLLTVSLMGPEPNDPPVMSSLINALRDRDIEVRAYAGSALAELGSAAVDPLIVAIQDADRFQRAGAAYALGRLGGAARPAQPQLLRALSDDDRDVRRQAAYALSRLLASERDQPSVAPPPVFPQEPK
ncbi:MAG: HEAT repeat domain-containing protein [Gemmataceae bacterium]